MIRKITTALALSCCLLAGCDHVDPTIAQKGALVLDRVMPEGFLSLDIEEGDSWSRNEDCKAKVSLQDRKDWFANEDGRITQSGPRTNFDVVELHAHREKSGWVIDDSEAAPEHMDMPEFEKRVQECLDTFRDRQKELRIAEKNDAEQTAHNLQSWQVSDAKASK